MHWALVRTLLRIRPAPLASSAKCVVGVRRVPFTTVEGTFWVDPVSAFGYNLTTKTGYEPGMRSTLAACLGPGKTFVDLGANEGYFSVIAAKIVGESGRVLAIEPQERLLPVINANLRLNDLHNVTVQTCGVDMARSARPISHPTSTGSSGLSRSTRYEWRNRTSRPRHVQLLDQYGINRVDLMKVDIEGGE